MKKQLAVLALAGLVSTTAIANISQTEPKLSHQYAELGYLSQSIDDRTYSGIGIRASFPVDKNVTVIGGILQQSGSETVKSFGVDVKETLDIQTLRVGVAYLMGLDAQNDEAIDLVLHGEIAQNSAKGKSCRAGTCITGSPVKKSGLILGAEIRAQLDSSWEAFGDLTLDKSTDDSNVDLTGGVRFGDPKGLQGFASYTITNNKPFIIGGRFNF